MVGFYLTEKKLIRRFQKKRQISLNKKFDFLSAKSTKFLLIIFHNVKKEFSENQQNYQPVIPGLSPKKYFFDSLCEWRSWSNRAGLDSAYQIGAIFGNIFQQSMWSRAGQPKTTLWTAFKKIIKNSVFSQFKDFPHFPNFFKKKKTQKIVWIEIHSSSTRPKSSATLATWRRRKTDQRPSTKFNPREFFHLLSSRWPNKSIFFSLLIIKKKD